MARNDVERVSAPDTTEETKRRNTEHEKGNRVHRREVRQAAKAGSSDYKSRYLARTRYEQAIVKNLKPMLGPNGDNETASQFLNGAVERRAKLFGADVSGANALTASELLTRAMNYVPPAPVQKPGKKEPGFIDKLAEVMSDGVKKSVTLDPTEMSSLSGASDVVQQAKNLGIDSEGVGTVVATTEGTKFVDANTGKARNLTDADRRDIRDYKSQIGADRIETKVIDPFGVRQAAKGGDGGNETAQVEAPVQGSPSEIPAWGPRIVINPKVFGDSRDALCVAMNEAFRIIMEINGFEPQAEPTPAQRRFFADTAYANDEVQLRRTILARICTFDTSISGKTSRRPEGRRDEKETTGDVGGGTPVHEDMSAADKLARANELLERLKGTDRYDEFKRRVDGMRAKYGNQVDDGAAGRGGAGDGSWTRAEFQEFMNSKHNDFVDGRITSRQLGDYHRMAYRKLTGTDPVAKNRNPPAADTARRTDETVVEPARNGYDTARNNILGAVKASTGHLSRRTNTALLNTARTVHRARIFIYDTLSSPYISRTMKSRLTREALKVTGEHVATKLAPHALAAEFAIGGIRSAGAQALDLVDTMRDTGSGIGDLGRAVKDVFTTKTGWKNLGLGLVGSLRDVGGHLTAGMAGNGDIMRDMMD